MTSDDQSRAGARSRTPRGRALEGGLVFLRIGPAIGLVLLILVLSQLTPAFLTARNVGNLLAGAVGTLWSRFDNATFFVLVAFIAASAGTALLLVDRPTRRLLSDHKENT